MRTGINLHHLVRQPINSLNPDQAVIYFRSEGQTERVNGIAQPIYQRFDWIVQIQPEPDKGQYQSNRVNENTSIRNVYLYALPGREKPAAMIRPMSRSGDFVYLPDEKTWWKVDKVPEDFSSIGWCRVQMTLQHKVPDEIKGQVLAKKKEETEDGNE